MAYETLQQCALQSLSTCHTRACTYCSMLNGCWMAVYGGDSVKRGVCLHERGLCMFGPVLNHAVVVAGALPFPCSIPS